VLGEDHREPAPLALAAGQPVQTLGGQVRRSGGRQRVASGARGDWGSSATPWAARRPLIAQMSSPPARTVPEEQHKGHKKEQKSRAGEQG